MELVLPANAGHGVVFHDEAAGTGHVVLSVSKTSPLAEKLEKNWIVEKVTTPKTGCTATQAFTAEQIDHTLTMLAAEIRTLTVAHRMSKRMSVELACADVSPQEAAARAEIGAAPTLGLNAALQLALIAAAPRLQSGPPWQRPEAGGAAEKAV